MKLTEEQILKIAISHQKQMGSVHSHAIIGTIVDAINEALSQHDVSKHKFAVEWMRNVNYGIGRGTEYFDAETKEEALKQFWEGKNKEAFEVNNIYVC